MSRPFDSFAIFAEMRTGSNFLEANLNEVPGLICHGEAFNPHFIGHKNRHQALGVTMAQREADPLRLLGAMKAQQGVLPGFRFFHDHDSRVLKHVLADRRCAKVVLTRNPVDSYVSRKIAAETGQWKLTDMKHQRSARVRFDPAEFEAHLAELQQFQQVLLHALQTSGQTAFYLAYEDVGDLEVLNGLVRFLGVEGRLGSVSNKLKKQNPAPLSEKVANFDEMTAALARLDRFDLTRTPNFEPRKGPMVPGYVAAAEAPLLFMPINGGPVARVEGWLAALDAVGPDALRRNFNQKSLRQWKRGHPGHRSFTVVTHPLERAHDAFWTRILPVSGPAALPALRETLRREYKIPLPEDGAGEDYGPERHRPAFLAFLQFLKGNLGGQTGIRVDQAWASQSTLLQGMAQFALPDMVLRAERLVEDLAILSAQIGRRALAPIGTPAEVPVPLSEIYDDELEAAAREAYQRDYMMFGYRAWRES